MTRTIFAIAMALFTATMFFSPAANACISCEYVPPVVNTPVYSHGGTHYRKSRSYSASKERRVKKHIAKTPRVNKVDRQEAAAAKPVKKPTVETASIEKDGPATKADTENSSITTAAADKPDVELTPAEDTQATANSCKKFFASVGMTLTVPCQ